MELKKRLLFLGAGAAGGAALMTVLQSLTASGTCGSADLWTILSAIATAAATAVALVVALDSNKQRRRDEQIRARLAAAQMTPSLVRCVGKLSAAIKILTRALDSVGRPTQYQLALQIFKEISEAQPTFDDLRSIISLPDDCVDRLASGFAQVKLLKQMIEEDRELFFKNLEITNDRRMQSSAYVGLTKGILATIEPAVGVCNQAALVKIGGPAVK